MLKNFPKWISLFLEYNYKIEIIYIEVPYDKMLSQNSNREYKVPVKYIEKLFFKLDIPKYNEAHIINYIT